MKKILLSAYCKTQEQKNIIKSLLEILLSKDYDIDIITNCELDIQKNNIQQVSSTSLLTKSYNVILAYNLKGYYCIRRLAKTKSIPVIYIIKQGDSIVEYLYDVSLVSRFLIINDGNELSRQLFPEDFSLHISYPYLPPQHNYYTTASSINILVTTDDETLLNIIPAINNYAKYNFTIITEIPSIIKKIVNINCKVLSAKRTNIIEYIKNAALIIGCGKPLLMSIGYNKPSIVVGKFGFGRRVTIENVEQHFYSFFKGRLGAGGKELIPFHLLLHEIDSCMNAKPDENEIICKSVSNFLNRRYEETASSIDVLICSANVSKSVLDIQLKTGSSYRFIAFNEFSWLVVDNRMLKIHAVIDQNDYDLIRAFEKGSSAETVMEKNLYNKTPEKFISFVKYLIAYKFLIPNNERADF